MGIIFIRIFFFLGITMVGYQVGNLANLGIAGALVGVFISGVIIFLERGMRGVSTRGLSSVVFGLILGLIMAKLVSDAIGMIVHDPTAAFFGRIIATLAFCYLGMSLAIRGREEFNLIIPYVRLRRHDQDEDLIVLDTSSIIDGRVVDICQTRFISARMVLPHFVLKELQQIADSSDPIKRQRGRRGLEILHSMQKSSSLNVTIHEADFPEIQDVDAKVVKLAKVLDAKILTLDFNLNKVAAIQGVAVLNINELANALKPVVYPGEMMQIKLIKEGKEHNQAVGYLEDGTMIVVEDARRFIGQTVKAAVTSVLQTQAGRMIFTKLEQGNHFTRRR